MTSQPDQDALKRWASYPPPNAKPQECKHCGRQFVIVCNDELFELCGNYLDAIKRRAK